MTLPVYRQEEGPQRYRVGVFVEGGNGLEPWASKNFLVV